MRAKGIGVREEGIGIQKRKEKRPARRRRPLQDKSIGN